MAKKQPMSAGGGVSGDGGVDGSGNGVTYL